MTERPPAGRGKGSWPGRSLLLAAGFLAVAALAALSVARVPADCLGALDGRLLSSGWHLRPPLRRVRIVPLRGRLDAVDVDDITPEGARLRTRLAFDYRIEPAVLAAHADRLGADGLEAVAADLARPVLERAPSGSAPAAVAPAVAARLAEALAAGGLAPSGLVARAGAADRFPPAGGAPAGSTPTGAFPARDPTGVRVVFIGLDGADWRILDPLLRAGRLPHLARLVARGVRAPLRSYDPMISPLLWTTMVTGVGPDRHGVADFQAIEAGTGRRVPITSRFRKVKALWNILDDAGLTSAFVGWWASYPAEAVRGVQVSNLVAFETVRPRPPGRPFPAGLAWPPEYLPQIAPRLVTAADLSYDDVRPLARVTRAEFEAARREVLDPPAAAAGGTNRRMVQKPLALLLSILTGSRNYATIAADLAARRPDLAAVYFEGIDMIGHRFQHCMPPALAICPAEDARRFGDTVTAFYVAQDRLLGRVLDAAGDRATVLVVSDHGFRSGAARPRESLPYTTRQPVEWHDPEGIFILSGPAARRGLRLQVRPTLFDIAPTLLYLLGLPQADDMPGRVFLPALDPAFVAAHPRRRVPSYETLGGPRRTPGSGSDPDARRAEADLLASLRALGYIGGDETSGRSPAGPAAAATGNGAGDLAPPSAPSGAAAPGEETQVFYHRNLATYFLKRRDYARAAEELRRANQRQKLPKTYQMLSEAYLALGRPDDAIAALREALDEIPGADPEPVLWLVRLHLAGPGGRDAALDEVRRYAARTAARPGLDDAIAGVLREDAGDARGALERYRRSFAADPKRILVAERLYALEPPGRRATDLLPALERTVRDDPRLDETWNLLGVLLAESGRDQESLAAFRRAVDLVPSDARYAANLGGALVRAGRWSDAAGAYERAQADAPSAATALKLGSVYRRLRDPERALAAFTSARDLGDSSPAPILGMALAQSEMGRADAALSLVEDGLRRHPEDAGLRRLRRDLAARPPDAGPPAPRPHAAGLGPGGP